MTPSICQRYIYVIYGQQKLGYKQIGGLIKYDIHQNTSEVFSKSYE